MCWNADISLNTFLFSCLALGFVYYTNTYTKYKTPLFDNPLAYLAFMSFVSMQLVEYFLWRNLKNREWNRAFSLIGQLLLYSQPILFISLTTNETIKTYFWYVYAVYTSIYVLIYSYFGSIYPYTIVKNGHLAWNIHEKMAMGSYKIHHILVLIFITVITYSLYQIGEYLFLGFVWVFLLASMYYSFPTWYSMWCWVLNVYMLWLVFRILIVLPYIEYSGLC